MNDHTMNKSYSLSLGAIICLIAAALLVYSLLLQGYLLPFSISTLHTGSWHWIRHHHLLIVALIPVYVAVIIFGIGAIAVCIGGFLQRWAKNLLLKTLFIL
jgi:hypothetical protein